MAKLRHGGVVTCRRPVATQEELGFKPRSGTPETSLLPSGVTRGLGRRAWSQGGANEGALQQRPPTYHTLPPRHSTFPSPDQEGLQP